MNDLVNDTLLTHYKRYSIEVEKRTNFYSFSDSVIVRKFSTLGDFISENKDTMKLFGTSSTVNSTYFLNKLV